MEEKMTEQQENLGVDLHRALGVLWKKAALILIVSVIGAVAALVLTALMVTPQYEATAMFYVNNSAESLENSAQSISSSDISAGKSLVESYLVILNTNATLEEIIQVAGVDYDVQTLRDKITAGSVNSTAIFSVTVESSSPERAAKVAAAIAQVLPGRIAGIIEGSSAIVVDFPVVPKKPSSPSYIQSAMIGFIFAFVLAVGVILMREIFDVTIRTEEDIQRTCAYPVLAHVPDMTQPDKHKAYGLPVKKAPGAPGKNAVLGDKMSFAAAESYKLLRTKIQFSFADDRDCHVIGVCSGLSGEGKSLTAVNLAYTLSQLNHRVILVDCDMRKASIADKLKLQKHPGLSNFLTKQIKLDGVIQGCGVLKMDTQFHVIAAGHNPPNPAELLNSSRMQAMMRYLRTCYDYIILDLPPVGEVSDAMVVAKEVDGVLLVVRKDYCNRQVLAHTVRQFEFIKAKILGVVCNYASNGDENGVYAKVYSQEAKKNRRS